MFAGMLASVFGAVKKSEKSRKNACTTNQDDACVFVSVCLCVSTHELACVFEQVNKLAQKNKTTPFWG
jgi:hypothetical protein